MIFRDKLKNNNIIFISMSYVDETIRISHMGVCIEEMTRNKNLYKIYF